jgi:hypothetical protein
VCKPVTVLYLIVVITCGLLINAITNLNPVIVTNTLDSIVFMANSCLMNVVSVKFAAWPWVCAVLLETSKEAVNLSIHQDGGRPSSRIPGILDIEASIAET